MAASERGCDVVRASVRREADPRPWKGLVPTVAVERYICGLGSAYSNLLYQFLVYMHII